MKRLLMVSGALAVLILIGTTVLGAQHQMGSRMQMGGQMDPLGMMGGDQIDPKTLARMLQLRGDMLKAMGEVLLKHGKAMEEVQ